MSVLKKFFVFAVCIFVILFCFRAFGLVKCTVAQYDLKRPTHFSFVTGNCMVDAGNGSRVYLKSLRGYGDEGADQ